VGVFLKKKESIKGEKKSQENVVSILCLYSKTRQLPDGGSRPMGGRRTIRSISFARLKKKPLGKKKERARMPFLVLCVCGRRKAGGKRRAYTERDIDSSCRQRKDDGVIPRVEPVAKRIVSANPTTSMKQRKKLPPMPCPAGRGKMKNTSPNQRKRGE